ncbi:MAG: glycosyltransferase family 39 protein [Pseudomonadota bacterium]
MEMRPNSDLDKGLMVGFSIAAGAVVLAKLNIAHLYHINWDEFLFLSAVHDYLRSDLQGALHTFHVHLFGWLAGMGDETEQIIAARWAMVALQVGTGLLLYRIGRRFFAAPAALFAVLLYFSVRNVLLLGADFRADPIATLLLVLCIERMLALGRGHGAPLVAGVAAGLALLVTIKSAFYAPVVGLLYLIGLAETRERALRVGQGVVALAAAATTFGALYLLHKHAVGAAGDAADMATRAYGKTIASQGFFPRWNYFADSLRADALFWGFLAFGLVCALRYALWPGLLRRANALRLLVLLLPALSFLFYRNAFPYYWGFALAGPALLAGLAWEALEQWLGRVGRLVNRSAALAAVVLILYTGFAVPFQKNLHVQRQFLDVVHRLFPEPVAYIDRCAMVSTFPHAGFFMSTWGMEGYHARGRPVFADILRREQPAFIVANNTQLNIALPDDLRRRYIPPAYDLLAEDLALLRDNYVHHWGPLYVAGKRVEIESAAAPARFEVSIAGTYTLEGQEEVRIDGAPVAPGGTVMLTQGMHQLAGEVPGGYVLRWGDNLPVPDRPPPRKALFTGF